MTTTRHPVTGVVLNAQLVRRQTLSAPDLLETVQLLHRDGLAQYQIAARLGTHPAHVITALRQADHNSGRQLRLFG